MSTQPLISIIWDVQNLKTGPDTGSVTDHRSSNTKKKPNIWIKPFVVNFFSIWLFGMKRKMRCYCVHCLGELVEYTYSDAKFSKVSWTCFFHWVDSCFLIFLVVNDCYLNVISFNWIITPLLFLKKSTLTRQSLDVSCVIDNLMGICVFSISDRHWFGN